MCGPQSRVSFCFGRHFDMHSCCNRDIRNDCKVSFWDDCRLANVGPFFSLCTSQILHLSRSSKVSDMSMKMVIGISAFFNHLLLAGICLLLITFPLPSNEDNEDCFIWLPFTNDHFSLKSTYNSLMNYECNTPHWRSCPLMEMFLTKVNHIVHTKQPFNVRRKTY